VPGTFPRLRAVRAEVEAAIEEMGEEPPVGARHVVADQHRLWLRALQATLEQIDREGPNSPAGGNVHEFYRWRGVEPPDFSLWRLGEVIARLEADRDWAASELERAREGLGKVT
jgi:hypothetical protein